MANERVAAAGTRLIEAAHRLVQGRLVAFPTETVYGLGADAENPQAVARIYAAKGRPRNHPLIVHLAPDVDPGYWAAEVPPVARQLMAAFWPGPLTLILPRAARIPDAVSGGQDSIGLRCPSHPVAQTLLHIFSGLKSHGCAGVAAPSANRFGALSPTRAEHVRSEFPELDDEALMVLEGGDTEVGIESTILDLSRLAQGVAPTLLRPGVIGLAQLAEVLGDWPAEPDAAAPRVSGSLKSHYAPRTPLALADRAQLQALAARPQPPAGGVAVLARDPVPQPCPPWLAWHTLGDEPRAWAHALYATLRSLDAEGHAHLVVQRPPDEVAWRAVADRLQRAAAGFDAAWLAG